MEHATLESTQHCRNCLELDATPLNVSVLILTYNEERNIASCIDSLKGIDDIVVIDSGSADRTCALAEEGGARVLTRKFDNFAGQRNFGLEEGDLKHEWVLHLDADEVATPEFLNALKDLVPQSGIEGYLVPSKTILNDRWLRYSGMYPTYQVRLGHRDRMRFKQVGHGQREDLAPEHVGLFPQPYLHYSFSHGITLWLKKHAGYAKAEAEQFLLEQNTELKLRDLFASSEGVRHRGLKRLINRIPLVLRPPLRFLHTYVFRRGFLEGREGLQYAVMLTCYEAMISVQILDTKTSTQANLDRQGRL